MEIITMNVLVAMIIMFWMKIRIVFHVQICKQLEEQDVNIVNIYKMKIEIYVKYVKKIIFILKINRFV